MDGIRCAISNTEFGQREQLIEHELNRVEWITPDKHRCARMCSGFIETRGSKQVTQPAAGTGFYLVPATSQLSIGRVNISNW
jgi:hypothetical protein